MTEFRSGEEALAGLPGGVDKRRARLSRGSIAWAVFEGGRNPYIVLVIIYIFMPYVGSTMIGNPIRGQEALSAWNQYFGWAVMLTAPLLGASIDKWGPRKVILAFLVGLMIPGIASLWWAKPDLTGLSVGQTMGIAMSMLLLFVYTEVLHNSLLVFAAGPNQTHKASGLAIFLGNFFSVVALGFTAWGFALPAKVHWNWVPHAPLFGLDAAMHEPERVVALLAAGLLAMGSIPFFIITPDAPRTDIPFRRVLSQAFHDMFLMLHTVRIHKDAVKFLLSRMFYVDGMNAVLIYSGIYAVGIMKWTPLEMLAYAILQSGLGTLGGVVGPRLDTTLGSKRAVQVEIIVISLGVLALLGMSPKTICYFWPYDASLHGAIWNGPVFMTLPDWWFIAIGTMNYIFVCANFTSSRTMLTRITPPKQSGAFFGVYALSGVATSWLAPTLVNWGTRMTQSQKGGVATILILFAAGLYGLTRVRNDAGPS